MHIACGNGMSLPPDMDEHFRTVEEDGEVLIYVKNEGNMKPLIREKSRTRKSRTRKSRDGCFGYPLEDRGALWPGLVSEVLSYTFLKYYRLADCKFSYNEMLDIKASILEWRKISNRSEGVERELGFILVSL
ncbi:hypothetical protein Tco_1270594 [Tanacetum coccineum]